MLNLGGEIIYSEPEVTGSTLVVADGFTFVMAAILSHLTMNFNIIYRFVLDSLFITELGRKNTRLDPRQVELITKPFKVRYSLESCLSLD